MASKRRPPTGKGVDATGGPVIDPTKNVLDLVQAGKQRQDDLREADRTLYLAELAHVKEMAELRAAHARELRKAETDRIDAIRAVDVGAVQRAAEVALTQTSTLAQQTATLAETLRTQVAAATAAQSTALTNGLAPVQKAIEELRQAQFLSAGSKAQVGETRLNYGAILGGVSVLLVLIFGYLNTRG